MKNKKKYFTDGCIHKASRQLCDNHHFRFTMILLMMPKTIKVVTKTKKEKKKRQKTREKLIIGMLRFNRVEGDMIICVKGSIYL